MQVFLQLGASVIPSIRLRASPTTTKGFEHVTHFQQIYR